jgi:hypothetical protein
MSGARGDGVSSPLDLARMPRDLALHALSFLGGYELARGACVSRGWRQLCDTPALWTALCLPAAVPADTAKESFARRIAVEREEARHQARLRQLDEAFEIRFEQHARSIRWFRLVNAVNQAEFIVLQIVAALLQLVLLPLRVDGAVEWPWLAVFAPTHLVSALLALQLLSVPLRAALPVLRGNSSSCAIDIILEPASRWPSLRPLLLALNAPWPVCAALFCVKLADADTDVSWTLIAALFVPPVLSVALSLAASGARELQPERARVEDAHSLALAAPTLALCVSALLAGVNGDALVAGDEPPLPWWGVLAPFWAAVGLQLVPWFALIRRGPVERREWLKHLTLCAVALVLALPSALLALRLHGASRLSLALVFTPWYAVCAFAACTFCSIVRALGRDD